MLCMIVFIDLIVLSWSLPGSELILPGSELILLGSELILPGSELILPGSELILPGSELIIVCLCSRCLFSVKQFTLGVVS